MRLGIIGGSGFDRLPGMVDADRRRIETPWGEPSDALVFGRIGATEIVFLPRHGPGHRLSPSEINYRANIDALKRVGCTDVISLAACGSFHEELPPGTFVLCDQFIDRTRQRAGTFFGDGVVAHVTMADPGCRRLLDLAAETAAELDIAHARGGTYVAIEGPQFATRAESRANRAAGGDVVGMTNLPEAALAREAELCHLTVAMVTDYDNWRVGEEVDVARIVAVMARNADNARRLIAALAGRLPSAREPCPFGCDRALDGAIISDPRLHPPETVRRLSAVAGRVLS